MAALEDLRRAEDNNVPYLNQPKYCFRSLQEALVNLNKGVSPPAYFDCRDWFRAGLSFFRDDFEM
ncbi:hypothetical protein J6590_093149 [Homalodisca vitripennis]|nr:hypothetical protein J6590_093149 [Homalodisca vitripennis]